MFVTCVEVDPLLKLGRLMKKHRIIPDVVNCRPHIIIDVLYPCDTVVQPGCHLTPLKVRYEPIIRWMADPTKFHTLAMIDPDAPSRASPTKRDWLHWLVGNIHGCDVALGQPLVGYIGSRPPAKTGQHRYVFLAFRQHCELDFDEPYIPNSSYEGRPCFSIKRFAKKYALGNPIAINFFFSNWEDDDLY